MPCCRRFLLERLIFTHRYIPGGLPEALTNLLTNPPAPPCRRFLLEWLSFTHRYIPLGLLEVVPQQLHWRPPAFVGR